MRFSFPSSQVRYFKKIPFLDFIWICISPLLALWLRDPARLDLSLFPLSISPSYEFVFISIIISLPVYLIFRINEGVEHHFSVRDALKIFVASIIIVLLSVYTVFISSRLEGVGRTVPLIYGLVLVIGMVSHRLISSDMQDSLKKFQRSVINELVEENSVRRIILVGLDPFALSFIRLIDHQSPRTVEIVVLASLREDYSGRSIYGVKIVGGYQNIKASLAEYRVHGVNVDEVWISDSSKYFNSQIHQLIIQNLVEDNVEVRLLSEALNLKVENRTHFVEKPYYKSDLDPEIKYYKFKRTLDIIFSVTLLVLLAPLILVLLIVVGMELGFPVFFWQQRVGRHNTHFKLYKIRTFPIIAEAIPNNSVVVGQVLSVTTRFIRQFRLDEYPQLLNILVGEMSGIGPRPLLPKDQPKKFSTRLLVRPGITGWAQINGGQHLTIEEKNALDCWYVYNMNLYLDIYIVCRTLLLLINGEIRNETEIEKAIQWMKTHIEYE